MMLDKFEPKVVIGQGLGKQEPWSVDLANKCNEKDISVWNEPLPDAKNPNLEMAQQWSDILRQEITRETTAVLHSASVISYLDALSTHQDLSVKNLVLLAGWAEDPGQQDGRWGNAVQKIFKRNGLYHLEPFLKLVEKHQLIWETISNSVRKQIIIVQSTNDPYVHNDQADFLKKNLPGSEIVMVKNAGHFQFRPKNGNRAEQNAQLPPEVQEKILKLIEN